MAMRTLAGLLLATLVAAADRKVLYTRTVYPPTWNLVGRASSHQWMNVLIAVKQQNLAALEAQFWAVSDPKSHQWRNFLSREEISAMVASRPEDMQVVSSWLQSGLSKSARVSHSADAINVRMTVGDAEKLFETEVHIFVHTSGHTILRTMGAHSVPAEVYQAIDFVEGMADFPMHNSPVQHFKTSDEKRRLQASSAMVVPQTLIEMYSVPEGKLDPRVSQGPAEFQDYAAYNKQDLVSFLSQTNLPATTIAETVGPYDGSIPGIESTLDVQYLLGVGQGQTDWYWTSQNWMYTFSHNLFNHTTVPNAMSISWGWAEDQQCAAGIAQSTCTTLGIDAQQYVTRVNTEFQKVGLRGVSVLVASGDSGANGKTDLSCTDTVLHAGFPGSSPYVTSVGATQLNTPVYNLQNPPPACSAQIYGTCASGGEEVAVSYPVAGFTSGGGFSSYAAMPSYQAAAVANYLTTQSATLPPASYFNSANRGYPDVAAMGNNFLIYCESEYGGFVPVGGTSASTPTFAGVVAHLNDVAFKKDGKPLGFLNPLLYQMQAEQPDTFTDVTVGDNKCTQDGCFATCQGFEAAPGWDPVTGLGTPVTSKMITYVDGVLTQHAQLKKESKTVMV